MSLYINSRQAIKDKINAIKSSVFMWYSVSTFIRTLSLAISGIIIMRWVLPSQIGIYNSYNVVVAYSFVLQLGVFTGLNRQIPYLLGQNKEKEAMELAGASIFYARFLTIATAILSIPAIFIVKKVLNLNQEQIWTVILVLFLTSISFYQNYLNVTYRSQKHFKTLAHINNVTSVVMFVSLIFVYLYSFYGLLFYYFFNNFLYYILTFYYRPIRIKGKYNLQSIRDLMKIGLPIFILTYIQQVSRTINKMILVYFGSTLLVGLFSPANAIFVAISFLPATISQFLYPKFSYLYGKHNNNKKILLPYLKKIYLFSAILIIPALLFDYFCLPYLFKYFLPKYAQGIFSVQIFFITGIVNISSIAVNMFYSIGDKKYASIYTFTRIPLMIVFPLLMMLFFNTLDAVSIGTLIGSVVSAGYLYYILNKILNEGTGTR